MTPDDVKGMLDRWRWRTVDARVTCVEDEGPRVTWTLFVGPAQVGHVRMRQVNGWTPEWWWIWEASRRTVAMLGLDDVPQSRQTAPEEASR